MIWNILRPRLWLLRHQWSSQTPKKKILSAIFILILLGGAIFLFYGLVRGLSGPAGDAYFIGFLPSALLMLVFFMLIQLGDTLYQFYLSPDMFWLVQAPLHQHDIYLAKLVECTYALWLPALFSSGVLLAFGFTHHMAWTYFPLVISLMLVLTVAFTNTGMLLVMLVTCIIPAKRARELLPVAFGLVSLVGVFGQRTLIENNMQDMAMHFQLVSIILQDPLKLLASLSLLTAITIAWVIASYSVYSAVHERTMNALRVVQLSNRKIDLPDLKRTRTLSLSTNLLTQVFPTDQLNILRKDWALLRRDPQQMLNLFLTPLMMAVIMAPMLGESQFSVFGYWLVLLYSGIFGMNTGQGLAFTAFTIEARVYSFICRAPISIRTIMLAKFWAAWIPSSIAWTVMATIGALLLKYTPWQWLAATGLIILSLAGACFTGVAASAASADLTSHAQHAKLVGPTAWLAMLYGLVWDISSLAFIVGLIFALAGQSTVVTTLLSVIQIKALPAYLPWLLSGIGLAGMLGITIPAAVLWRKGYNRLKIWEYSG